MLSHICIFINYMHILLCIQLYVNMYIQCVITVDQLVKINHSQNNKFSFVINVQIQVE